MVTVNLGKRPSYVAIWGNNPNSGSYVFIISLQFNKDMSTSKYRWTGGSTSNNVMTYYESNLNEGGVVQFNLTDNGFTYKPVANVQGLISGSFNYFAI